MKKLLLASVLSMFPLSLVMADKITIGEVTDETHDQQYSKNGGVLQISVIVEGDSVMPIRVSNNGEKGTEPFGTINASHDFSTLHPIDRAKAKTIEINTSGRGALANAYPRQELTITRDPEHPVDHVVNIAITEYTPGVSGKKGTIVTSIKEVK